MKPITKAQIAELAAKALASGNPYIKASVRYMVDKTPMFIHPSGTMTQEEIDAAYISTASKDIRFGYEARKVGYYDKWYRYNRADEGRAYDLGVRLAANTPGCPDEFHIIECAC